jgi:hypothetical protein
MILKGNKLFVMKKSAGWTEQKAVAVAIPARYAASIPVARKRVAELSDGSVSTLARFLAPHLRLSARADIGLLSPIGAGISQGLPANY